MAAFTRLGVSGCLALLSSLPGETQFSLGLLKRISHHPVRVLALWPLWKQRNRTEIEIDRERGARERERERERERDRRG